MSRHRISGITDFGDLTHTPLVCDLAVAIADVIDGRADCLRLAESMIAGYASATPLGAGEIALLADLVAGRCAAALVIPAWLQQQQGSPPEVSPGAWAFLQEIRSEGVDRVTTRFARAVERPPYRRRATSDLKDARDRTLGPLSLSYRRPGPPRRRQGSRAVRRRTARGYLDAYNNVPVLGHSHPAVVDAVASPARHAQHQQPLPAGGARRARRAAAGDPAGPPVRPGAARELRQRGQRPRLADRAPRHRATRRHRHRVGLPRRHRGDLRVLAGELAGRRCAPATCDWSIRRSAGLAERTVTSRPQQRYVDRGGPGVAAMLVDGVFTSDGILGPAHEWTRDAVARGPRGGRAVRRGRGAGRLRPHRGRPVELRGRRGATPTW